MYMNIPTNTAIMLIARHLCKNIPEERPKQNEALIAALKLVMLAIMLISGHLRKNIPGERPKQNEALIVALKLVMLNNIFLSVT